MESPDQQLGQYQDRYVRGGVETTGSNVETQYIDAVTGSDQWVPNFRYRATSPDFKKRARCIIEKIGPDQQMGCPERPSWLIERQEYL